MSLGHERTLAEKWRENKPKSFVDAAEYLKLLQAHDPDASFKLTDLGPVIRFSDGSIHRMGS